MLKLRLAIWRLPGASPLATCPSRAHTAAMPVSSDIILKDVSKLEQHPLNEKVYGKVAPDAKLVDSVKKVGVLTPIVVTSGGTILSGARRWLAAKDARLDKIPARLFTGDELAQEQYLIHANTQRVKTRGQLAREATYLLQIERALAVKRIKAGKKVHPETNLSKGRARDLVAKEIGVSGQTVTKMAEVVEKADAGDTRATKALADLDENKISVHKAHKAVRRQKRHKPDPSYRQAAKLERMLRAKKLEADVRRTVFAGQFTVILKNLPEKRVRALAKA